MAIYEIHGTLTGFTFMHGQYYEQNYIGHKGVKKVVDAHSLKHLQDLFTAYSLELTGEGLPCYRLSVVKARHEKARAFPGFARASLRGGSLTCVVNEIAAKQMAVKEASPKASTLEGRKELGLPSLD
jgi:glutamate/tyrosine decarboxylase-like PLP-dependent enzyme